MVVATASPCLDKVLLLLAKDDRLPKMLTTIDAEIANAIGRLENISFPVWQALSACAGLQVGDVRNCAISAAWAAASHMNSRFREALRLPYTLLQGDRVRNLEELTRGARPDEDNSGRIWD
eukprot:3854719-Pyramimonas_sp.AAC.1